MLVYKYLDIKGTKKTIDNKSVLLKCPTEYKDLLDSKFWMDEKEKKNAYDLYVNYLLFEELRTGRIKASTSLTKVLRRNAMSAVAEVKKNQIFKKQFDLAAIYALSLKFLKKKDIELRNQFYATIENVLIKIRDSTLTSCFGSSFDSFYLWSEYAEGHKGVCMEYDVNYDEYRKVVYKKELPVFQLTKVLEIYFGHQICNKEIDTSNKAFWFALDPIFTKSIKYANEEEIRCVFSNNKRHKDIREEDDCILLKMPAPNRIFIGSQTSDDLERAVRDAYPEVTIEKMQLSSIKKSKVSLLKE